MRISISFVSETGSALGRTSHTYKLDRRPTSQSFITWMQKISEVHLEDMDKEAALLPEADEEPTKRASQKRSKRNVA